MKRDDETLAVETGVREVDRREGRPGRAIAPGEERLRRRDAFTEKEEREMTA